MALKVFLVPCFYLLSLKLLFQPVTFVVGFNPQAYPGLVLKENSQTNQLAPWLPGPLAPWLPGSLDPWFPGPTEIHSVAKSLKLLGLLTHQQIGNCNLFFLRQVGGLNKEA